MNVPDSAAKDNLSTPGLSNKKGGKIGSQGSPRDNLGKSGIISHNKGLAKETLKLAVKAAGS